MTIRKGQDWGTTGELGAHDPIVSSDRAMAELFSFERGELNGPTLVGLVGGDLARTVGATGTADDLRLGARTTLPIDLGIVSIDGSDHVMVASLVVRRAGWRGEVTVVMNASFLGSWNVAPKGHPNDGRFDVITAELSLANRWKARSRLATGTHMPHPDIEMRRLKSGSVVPHRRARVWVDGRLIGPASLVEFVVRPDAARVVI
jgi:hypothetical protein